MRASCKADITISMAEVQSSATASAKRHRKSVDRTLAHLDALVAGAAADDGCGVIFGSVVGGADAEQRHRSATSTAAREGVAGFVLEGYVGVTQHALEHGVPASSTRLM